MKAKMLYLSKAKGKYSTMPCLVSFRNIIYELCHVYIKAKGATFSPCFLNLTSLQLVKEGRGYALSQICRVCPHS